MYKSRERIESDRTFVAILDEEIMKLNKAYKLVFAALIQPTKATHWAFLRLKRNHSLGK
jgi:hypothetical protein